jgi:hypothetical protein
MSQGIVELEPEVRERLLGLTDDELGHLAFYIDLLQEQGVHLDEPYSRQLRGSSASCASTCAANGGASATTPRAADGSCS